MSPLAAVVLIPKPPNASGTDLDSKADLGHAAKTVLEDLIGLRLPQLQHCLLRVCLS